MPYPPRRAEPGQTFTTHHYLDGEVVLHADAEGVVRPRTPAEHRAADEFGLPIARKAMEADEVPATPAKETKP